MNELLKSVETSLNEMLVLAGIQPLASTQSQQFAKYCDLLLRWNARMNLTAVRNQEEILSRHFVESIACACALPQGVEALLDYGSGAGFPGIPIALCRPEIAVTLAESQGKKASFLREAARVLELSATVYAGRAESLTAQFDCVTLRAVDSMGLSVVSACGLVRPGGWLVVMTTIGELAKLQSKVGAIHWNKPVPLAGSERQIIALARVGSS